MGIHLLRGFKLKSCIFCVVATIKSTVDACDVTDHELTKLVASLLEVCKKRCFEGCHICFVLEDSFSREILEHFTLHVMKIAVLLIM